MKKFLFIIISILFISFSCDKVDSPYNEEIQNNENNSSTFVQNILIEDYTAHTCVNCPRAARVLKNIHETYGERIIPLALHVSSLAQPYNSPFQLDFRTTEGTELDNEFGLSESGLPKGMINRTEYNNDIKVPDGEWITAVSTFLDKTPSLGIKLHTATDTINKFVNIDVNIHILKDTMQNLNLCIYIIENEITGGQLDQDVPGNHVVSDYEFNDVLRTSVNGTWGSEISSINDTLKNGNILSSKYDKISLNSEWEFKNLGIIVFVYDKDSKQIIQADNLSLFSNYITNEN